MTSSTTAVVIVSGGSAISPFEVFTSPASPDGVADADPGFAGFSGPPEVTPAELTVDPLGSIDDALTWSAGPRVSPNDGLGVVIAAINRQ